MSGCYSGVGFEEYDRVLINYDAAVSSFLIGFCKKKYSSVCYVTETFLLKCKTTALRCLSLQLSPFEDADAAERSLIWLEASHTIPMYTSDGFESSAWSG